MLDKYLKKLGVSSVDELNEEEKKVFYEWQDIMNGRKITDEEVKKWLESEYELATSRICEEGLNEKVLMFRQIELRFIKKILNFIRLPELEKKAIEDFIK